MSETQRDTFSSEAGLMLEQNAYRYHVVGSWVGLSLNPVFALTDYHNFPEYWQDLFLIRLLVSSLICISIFLRRSLGLNSSVFIAIPFLLISIQNAYVYSFIGPEDLLGQNLSYMALAIGASMFILWKWMYSLMVVVVSAIATSLFISTNTHLNLDEFFVNGGLLLLVTAVFMLLLIQTRYNLTLKTITAQVALESSNRLLEKRGEEIRQINENLEVLVQKRTEELQKKNIALEHYAFINSHKLRAPVARILGLINLLSYEHDPAETAEVLTHMKKATDEMDDVVREITKSIEQGSADVL